MSDFHEENLGDSFEDEQLTIRIPNPKVYMARQSLWIGRRGKPRCDHCRLNNLKCDRVLPACNHCSWAAGRECKYTPLPTPAHRGIPRCDRCRVSNLKCDRNLPVCNHCKEQNRAECNYTPKKRRKMITENAQSSSEQHDPKVVTDSLSPIDVPERIDFYGQQIAPTPMSRKHGIAPSPSTHSHSVQTGRFFAELPPVSRAVGVSLPVIAPKHNPSSHRHTISQSYHPNHSLHYIPWSNPSFAPLPDFMNRLLKSLSPVEFPDPALYIETLSAFFDGVMPELRETSCLTSDVYTNIYQCLTRGETSNLAPRMREWASYHHLCPGSDNFCLILSPREDLYQADDLKRDACRRKYCAMVDDVTGSQPENLDIYPRQTMDGAELFERWPVRDQLFDILTYAHIAHKNSLEMLSRIRQLGFASGSVTWPMTELYTRLCPTCGYTGRQISSPPNFEANK